MTKIKQNKNQLNFFPSHCKISFGVCMSIFFPFSSEPMDVFSILAIICRHRPMLFSYRRTTLSTTKIATLIGFLVRIPERK